MTKTLFSSPPQFLVSPLPSLPRFRPTFPTPRLSPSKICLALHDGIPTVHSSPDFADVLGRVKGILYMHADAAVAAGDSVSESSDTVEVVAAAAPQKNDGWFGFISDAMEIVLKVLKDVLSAVHVPYSYGFAIILLTVIVKIASVSVKIIHVPRANPFIQLTLSVDEATRKLKKPNQVGSYIVYLT